MAVTVEQMNVILDAKIGPYMAGIAKAQAETNRRAAAIEARYAALSRNIKNSASTAALSIGSAFGGIAGYLGAQAVIEYANAWTRVTRSVDGSESAFRMSLQSAGHLNKLASEARVDLEAYSKLYIRTSAAIRDYNYASGTAEKVTSTLAKALKLGGASASEQASVLLQFSQALQKGKLDGDEFRTVMENAGIVQELLAKRLGVSKGEIIKMAAAGKLQIKDLVGSMVDGAAQIDAIYKRMPQTVDEAFTVLRNNVIQFLGEADKATGASQGIVNGLQTIGENLKTISVVAGAILASATLRMAAFAAASIAAANPLTLIAAAIGGLTVAYGVFGDEVKTTSDGVVTLKDSINAFADVIGGEVKSAINEITESLSKMGVSAESAQKHFSDFSASFISEAPKLAGEVYRLGDAFDGLVGRVGRAWLAIQQWSWSKIGLTDALDYMLEMKEQQAKLERQIALARGVEQTSYGNRLEDFHRGKIPTQAELDSRKAAKNGSDSSARRSQFEREVDQIKKRTEALKAEIETIGQSTFAQEKARAAAALRAAAVATAAKQGRAVLASELAAIERLSEEYAKLQVQAAFLNKLQTEREGNADLRNEIDLLGLEGAALEGARIEQQLLNEAKKAGIELTPQREAEIRAIAKEREELTQTRDVILQTNEASKDALKSFITDLHNGKSAAEALGGALDKLADKLLDAGLNTLFGGQGGLGSVLSGIIQGFDGGGYTGQGGKYQPAGIVHKGEVVWSQDDIRRAGGVGVVEAMRKGGTGYANGGVVMPSLPVMPTIPKAVPASAGNVTVNVPISIDARGATSEGVSKMQSDLIPQIKAIVDERIVRNMSRNATVINKIRGRG